MVLLEPDKTRVRIHMRVPVLGVQNSGFALGYRFTNVMGLLEYRMNNLQPNEYMKIVGVPLAAGSFYINNGNVPTLGSMLSVVINSLPAITYSVQQADLNAQDPLFSAVTNLATAVNQAVGTQWIASSQPAVQPIPGGIQVTPAQYQCAIIATTNTNFTATFSAGGNMTGFTVEQGTFTYSSATFKEDNVTEYGYLGICDYLESKIATASDLMKFTNATGSGGAGVIMRQDETQIRYALWTTWCKRLAEVFGIPLFPVPPVGRFGGNSTGMSFVM